MNSVEDYKRWKGKKNKSNSKQKQLTFPKTKNGSKRSNIFSHEEMIKKYENFDQSKADIFEKYPFCQRTLNGLRKGGFVKPTAIQKASIIQALIGRDILGAAKTGSGKTLAFVIPILECLFYHRWNSVDGPGALIISPTRELAFQTFEVLRKVGLKHDFSAGLVIGGKSVGEEARHICNTNILVCTPGRLLQHMDQTHYFSMENLKILVLDEADKLLEMGFEVTLNAILENIPNARQTLLFSATQTKSIKHLARLCLKNPAYISVHSESNHCTPSGLKQRYIVCQLQDKVNLLYSFVRNHVKSKVLVFLSSCKQVQFLFAAFCRLRPGIPVLHLHGKMNQLRRMAVYQEFCRKKFALLLATDVAARGLDFPAIDWVIQLDCPENVDTYIHRAGRTARLHESGNGLLVLLPSEKDGMIAELGKKKVPIEMSEVNAEKLTKIDGRMQSMCAEDIDMKEKAQRCFVSYVRTIYLMKNKNIFRVNELPLSDFSSSLGMAIAPRVRFLQRKSNVLKNAIRSDAAKIETSDDINTTQSNDASGLKNDFHISDEADGEFVSVKRRNVFDKSSSESDDGSELEDVYPGTKNKRSKAAEAKRLLRKGLKVNQKIKFDDTGSVAEAWPPAALPIDEGECERGGINIDEAKKLMEQNDIVDREKHKKKIREKHKLQRKKAKTERTDNKSQQANSGGLQSDEDEVVAYLGGESEEDGAETEQSDDQQMSNSSDISDDDTKFSSKRRKINATNNGISSNDVCVSSDTFDLSIQEQENLALHLLSSKR